MGEFRKAHQFIVFSCNTPVQWALAEFLAEQDHYLGLAAFYQAKRDFFLRAMEGSRFVALPSRGTYFQLFRYDAISDEHDAEFARRMTREVGVASIPVSVFYRDREDNKVVRFCFAKSEATLAEGAERLARL
jgi:methionine aminotransferase